MICLKTYNRWMKPIWFCSMVLVLVTLVRVSTRCYNKSVTKLMLQRNPVLYHNNSEIRSTGKPKDPLQGLSPSQLNRKLSLNFDGRLGNHMFMYASLFGIARTTNRLAVAGGAQLMQKLFTNLTIPFSYRGGATLTLGEQAFAKFDSDLVHKCQSSVESVHLGSLVYLQSFKYFVNQQRELHLEFKFAPHLVKQAEHFFTKLKKDIQININNSRSPKKNHKVTFVGVHQRLGDMLSSEHIALGYLVANKTYFEKSMTYFRRKYPNVHFIVASDDTNWSSNHLNFSDVTLSKKDQFLDFVILSRCDHVIMSVGTFGWWAGWLADGEVTYLDPPFKPGSTLHSAWKKEDFFPTNWKGIS